MKVVSNTTPLIYLAKGNLLYVLKELFELVYIPQEVYKEAVDAGLAKGYSDAQEIENACGAWIVTRAINIDLGVIMSQKREERPEIDRMLRGIHDGEIEVLSLAIELDVDKIIADDRAFIKVVNSLSEIFKGELIGTGDVLDIALRRRIITQDEYTNFLDGLGSAIAWVE
ncbi:hypothetical protein C5S31_10155 [ANME-1 cluster archaeon GoMg2]|nr:hypothetical protein [ANME-1 cluster archaeon GoMg2]